MHCIQIMDNKSSSILLLVCYKISLHLHSAFNRVALMLLLINIDNAYYCISIAMCDVHTTAQFICRIWNGPHTIVQMNWYLFGMSSVQQCDCFMIKENKMQITSVNIAHFVWYLEKLNSHRIFQPRSIMILSIFFCISLSNFELHENMCGTVCSMRRKPVSSWNDFNPHQ